MKASKPRFKTPEETDAVFYEAFKHCDSDVMAALWADTDDAVCVHPGAGALIDHQAIIRSCTNIFSNNHSFNINHTGINRVVLNDLAVFVVAEEILDSGGGVDHPREAVSVVRCGLAEVHAALRRSMWQIGIGPPAPHAAGYI